MDSGLIDFMITDIDSCLIIWIVYTIAMVLVISIVFFIVSFIYRHYEMSDEIEKMQEKIEVLENKNKRSKKK